MDDAQDAAALISSIEERLKVLAEPDPLEVQIEQMVTKAMKDVHHRFVQIERAVGINQ